MAERQLWADWSGASHEGFPEGKLGSPASYGDGDDTLGKGAERLFQLAQEQQQKWIIEVGVWQGYTSLLMAAASLHQPNTKVLCVDLWKDLGGTKSASGDWIASWIDMQHFLKVATEAGLISRIVPLRMDTVRAAAVWPVKAGPAGLIHLDAVHTHEDVMRDVGAWLPHLAPGGMLVLHDYYPPYPGLMEAVDQLASQDCWTDFRLTGCTAEMRYMPKHIGDCES